jgi:hypothetical protein
MVDLLYGRMSSAWALGRQRVKTRQAQPLPLLRVNAVPRFSKGDDRIELPRIRTRATVPAGL